MNNAVQFDPSKPFKVINSNEQQSAPQFDPSKPFKVVSSFNQQQMQQPEEESGIGLRDVARTGARAVETFVGAPGDLASLGLGLASGLTGGIVPNYEKVQENLPISLPTSQQVRKGIKTLTGEALEPQSRSEKAFDDFVSDVISFTNPLGIAGKISKGAQVAGMGLKGAAKLAGIRTAGGEIAKSLGASEGGQELTKGILTLGTMFGGNDKIFTAKYKEGYDKARSALPKAEPSAIPKIKKELIDAEKAVAKISARAGKIKESSESFDKTFEAVQAAKDKVEFLKERLNVAVPVEATADASKIKDTISNVERYVQSGDSSAPGKKFLGQKIDQIQKYLFGEGNNKIPAEAAWELKKDFNSQYGEVDKQTKKYFGELIDGLKDSLVEYGSKVNPEFGKSFIPAEDIYAGLKGSNTIHKFFKDHKNVTKLATNPKVKAVLGIGGLTGATKIGGPLGGAVALVAGATAYGAKEAARLGEFIYRSKEAQKYYADVLKNSIAGNVSATAKSLQKLNKIADHEDKKNQSSSE